MAGYSEEAAQFIYDRENRHFTRDGKINPEGIENVKDFLTRFGITPKKEAPVVDDLLAQEFKGYF